MSALNHIHITQSRLREQYQGSINFSDSLSGSKGNMLGKLKGTVHSYINIKICSVYIHTTLNIQNSNLISAFFVQILILLAFFSKDNFFVI